MLRLLLVLSFGPAALLACGDDDDDSIPAVCEEIAEACHEVDDGEGRPHECHETAEEGDATWCDENSADCIATCEAAAE